MSSLPDQIHWKYGQRQGVNSFKSALLIEMYMRYKEDKEVVVNPIC